MHAGPRRYAQPMLLTYPFTDTWWIDPGSVLGGRYPGGRSVLEQHEMLASLVDQRFGLVVNLQERSEDGREGSVPYEATLRQLAEQHGLELSILHEPIRDHDVPSVAQARRILDAIDDAIDRGVRVYVHCWGGHGRTGLVAGCLHRRRGCSPEEALDAIADARAYHVDGIARIAAPQTPEQRDFVRAWRG